MRLGFDMLPSEGQFPLLQSKIGFLHVVFRWANSLATKWLSIFKGLSTTETLTTYLSITALRSTHLLSFGFCHVASLHISRSFHFPDHIFAFLMGCASRFAAKNNPLNFVPPLHEFFWLSDACIQIKWHSPTPSSPSFLAWRWLRCWRKINNIYSY